jgi:starch phosphorylase
MVECRNIAYFSMEIEVNSLIPSYSGGLGVLAGDLLRSFADMRVPAVGVTLLPRKGYFFQHLDRDGNQTESPMNWNPEDLLKLEDKEVTVPIGERELYVRAWRYDLKETGDWVIPVYFLDTDFEKNPQDMREIGYYLYGGDEKYRLSQEIVLGIGGVRMLSALGHNICIYHMNEGHTALLTLELLKRYDASIKDESRVNEMKERCVFTTHTPVPAGHDVFPKALVKELLGRYLDDATIDFICTNGSNDKLNMTLLALRFSHYVNGVAKKHGEISRSMFPEYPIDSITNGVRHQFWVSKHMSGLFDKHIIGWRTEPSLLRAAIILPEKEVLRAHFLAKKDLINLANRTMNAGMDYHTFTIGFARRFTKYKRPTLILQDIERLRALGKGKLQIIFAGKAHPKDTEGKECIKKVFTAMRSLGDEVKITFLENYDVNLASLMVSGCDLWLNTPKAPYEASGTSGMKAALNGVPSLSSLDGWWLEGHIEGVTGWSIGRQAEEGREVSDEEDARDLYDKLEKVIMPIFYSEKDRWAKTMKYCIGINGVHFNSYRMVNQYLAKAYGFGEEST